jgi:hypothetical protein
MGVEMLFTGITCAGDHAILTSDTQATTPNIPSVDSATYLAAETNSRPIQASSELHHIQ